MADCPVARLSLWISLHTVPCGVLWRTLRLFSFHGKRGILTECHDAPLIPDLLFDPTPFQVHCLTISTTMPNRPRRVPAGRRSARPKRGRSPTTGRKTFPSPRPKWICSRRGSAISSTNCSGHVAECSRGSMINTEDRETRRFLP